MSTTEFCCHPLTSQHVTQNQIRLNLCNLLQRQTSVAKTKISTKILQNTGSDLSPWHVVQLVSVTYCLTCIHRVISRICHSNVLHVRVLGPVCAMKNSVCSVKKSVNGKQFLVQAIFFTYQKFLNCRQTSKMRSISFGNLQCFVRWQNLLSLDRYPASGHLI